MKKKRQFDHLLVVMGPIENDARTLNLAQTLSEQKEKVLILGIGKQKNIIKQSEYLSIQTIVFPPYNRMFKLWFLFGSELLKILKGITAKKYWAMDLYSLPMLILGKNKNSKVCYDSREVYSALGTNVGHPLKQWFITEIERYFIKRADVIFTSGKMDSEYIAQFYEIVEPPVIMNLPNVQKVERTDKLRSHFGISSKKKIMIYQGMIHPGRGLEPFLQILGNFPNWVLCVLGSGRHWQNIMLEIDRLGISNQVYKSDPVPYNELAEWTASADAGLCYIEPLSESLRLALPNKLFEYAMAGIPVVCSDLPQMSPIVKEFGNGILLQNQASIDQWFNGMTILSDSESYSQMTKAATQLAEKYNWQAQEPIIYELIK
ncbi:MAG: glycosyltransferase family 4 protein [Bacteroidetes bacterium]|nr:glycosyltransferase family 4 protein [Bacteroidota bacterium]